MKFKFKKYLYLLNDITALMLKKDQLEAREETRKLRIYLIALSALLLISIFLNIYFVQLIR
jgi:hypothetical protein